MNIDGDGYHIFTELRIGKQTFRALIDTGASKTVIGKDLVPRLKKLKLMQEGESLAKGIGEQMLETSVARIPKIKLGSFELKDLHVGVLDLEHIAGTYRSMGLEPFDLILGGDILHHFDAVISYKKGRMTLTK